MLELVVVAAVIVSLAGIAIPSAVNTVQTYRGSADARAIAGQLALAKMRAAAKFTKSRLTINSAAGTYQIELWNKTSNLAFSEKLPKLGLHGTGRSPIVK